MSEISATSSPGVLLRLQALVGSAVIVGLVAITFNLGWVVEFYMQGTVPLLRLIVGSLSIVLSGGFAAAAVKAVYTNG